MRAWGMHMYAHMHALFLIKNLMQLKQRIPTITIRYIRNSCCIVEFSRQCNYWNDNEYGNPSF